MYAYLMKKFAFSNFPEKGFDIVMFNKKVAAQVKTNVEANSSIFLQILGMGFRQTSISYKKRERKTGVSKWTMSKKIKLFIDSFVAFSYAPIRMVTLIGISMFILGSLWTAYIIIRKLVFHDLASGWPASDVHSHNRVWNYQYFAWNYCRISLENTRRQPQKACFYYR